MANGAYKYGMAEIVRGNIDYLNDNIKAMYVNISGTGTLYSVDLTAHQFLDDVASGAIKATSANLTGKTVSDAGVLDCDNFSFSSVAADGNDYEALIFFKDTGTPATSPLLFFFDSGTDMAQTPDGNNINVTIPAGGLATLGG